MSHLEKLFRSAHAIGKKAVPFISFEWMCNVQVSWFNLSIFYLDYENKINRVKDMYNNDEIDINSMIRMLQNQMVHL